MSCLRVLPALLLLAAFGPGCVMTNVTAEELLRDAVVGLNDEVRWNRIDLAAQRVTPIYMRRFRASHQDWHRELQIADAEVVHVEMGEDRGRAKARVTFRWYDMRTMLISETTLEQRWRRTVRGFVLDSEEVTEGNARLMRIPEDVREEIETAEQAAREAAGENDDDDDEEA